MIFRQRKEVEQWRHRKEQYFAAFKELDGLRRKATKGGFNLDKLMVMFHGTGVQEEKLKMLQTKFSREIDEKFRSDLLKAQQEQTKEAQEKQKELDMFNIIQAHRVQTRSSLKNESTGNTGQGGTQDKR